MVDSAGLDAILNRLETGKRLSKQDCQNLIAAARSQQITLATGDRAVAIGGNADGAVIVTGDHNILIDRGNAESLRELMKVRPSEERRFLKQVEKEVSSRLDKSLFNMVLINLVKHTHPEHVERIRTWDADVKIGDKPSKPIPPNASALEVFEHSEIAERLLILGEPGVGKTTTMLELAQALINKAKQDADQPIPALLNLSSWESSHQSIPDWLVSELRSKYDIEKGIGSKWLKGKQLLPLLDGLDEVKSEYQETCVKSINQWLEKDRFLPLVVCSRREEYTNYKARLSLNGAIILQTLTDEQIQEYLTAVNRTDLRRQFQQDVELLELIKVPLFLNIALLSYEEFSSTTWQQLTSKKQKESLLLDAYVERMLHRYVESSVYGRFAPPKAARTRQWLIYLATQLQQISQTEFANEKIKPSWLLKSQQETTFKVLCSLAYGIVGLWLGEILGGILGRGNIEAVNEILSGILGRGNIELIGKLFGGISEIIGRENIESVNEILGGILGRGNIELIGKLFGGMIGGMIGGTIGSSIESNTPVEVITWSSDRAFKGIKDDYVYRFLTVVFFVGVTSGWKTALVGGLLFLLSFALFRGLRTAESNEFLGQDSFRRKANQGIHKSITNAFLAAMLGVLIFCSICSISASLVINPTASHHYTSSSLYNLMIYIAICLARLILWIINSINSSADGVLMAVLPAWLFGGGAFLLNHLFLRFVLFYYGLTPWNYARFLNYCTQILLLQRIGGHFRFIHQLLQEHFAEMPMKE